MQEQDISSELYDTIFQETKAELDRMHQQYDRETDHSQKLRKQYEWNAYIRSELEKLAEFEDQWVLVEK